MIKVLFVCHGNICRSTMAEFVFKDMVKKENLSDKFLIQSAATSNEEIGNHIHRGTRKKLKEVGIPYDEKKVAVKLKKSDYDKFDYIIGMDSMNIVNINRILGGDPKDKVFKLLEFCDKERDIADPWYTGNFDVTYEDIVEGCEALFAHILKEDMA